MCILSEDWGVKEEECAKGQLRAIRGWFQVITVGFHLVFSSIGTSLTSRTSPLASMSISMRHVLWVAFQMSTSGSVSFESQLD